MNILVIEDNSLKREKIIKFLKNYSHIVVSEAASYNSGLTLAHEHSFDFLVVDMSMPTFDRNEQTQGGRFRALGGKEIVHKLVKIQKLPPFVILTGYKDFSVGTQSLSIAQINDLLGSLGESYLGCILFESSDNSWQEELGRVMGKLGC